MSESGTQYDTSGVVPWDPAAALRPVGSDEVRYSRGFLRSRPERWFPAFSAQWLPLAHSLGAELRLVEVKPLLMAPRGLESAFAATVDGEPIGLFIDTDSVKTVLDATVPGGTPAAQSTVLEYIARRFLASLALSWSGSESSLVQFRTDVDPWAIDQSGAVKLTCMINNAYCTIWITVGPALLDRLDGLWRRQMQADSKRADAASEIRLEVGQLAVPPSLLTDYTKRGAVVDLESAVTDQITLKVDGRPWFPARLCTVDQHFGLEILPGAGPAAVVPDGHTRLCIELGALSVDAHTLAELSQVGALLQTHTPVSNRVELTVNGDRVASGTLCVFEGRFAVSVG